MAHWGDWALQQFNFRIIGEIRKHRHLEEIFGEEFLRPKEREDLVPYNPDPSEGEVVGFLCFFTKPFTFSVSYGE